MREAFCLDPCDPPFGRCAACQGLVDVCHIAPPDGEKEAPAVGKDEYRIGTCPTCGADLHQPAAIAMLDEPELLLMQGRCPHCAEQATFRWADGENDTVVLRPDPEDATQDYVLSGWVICQHCGAELEGFGQASDATHDWRWLTRVKKKGRLDLRAALGRRLRVGPR